LFDKNLMVEFSADGRFTGTRTGWLVVALGLGLGGLELELLGLETVFRRPPRFWPRTSAPPSQRRTRCHFRRLCSPCPSRCTRFPGCTRRQILASVDKPCPLPRRRPPRRSWARLGAAGPSAASVAAFGCSASTPDVACEAPGPRRCTARGWRQPRRAG